MFLRPGQGLGSRPLIAADPVPVHVFNVDLSHTIPTSPIALAQLGYAGRGTLYMRWSDPAPRPTASGFETLCVLSDGTAANRIEITKAMSNGNLLFRITSGGVVQVSVDWSSLALVANRQNTLVITFDASLVQFFLNGVDILRKTSPLIPNTPSSGLAWGRNHAGGNVFSGAVREVRWYNHPLTGTLARALSNTLDLAPVTFDPLLDLVAFMGQSNSVGSGEASDYPPSYKNTIKLLPKNLATGVVAYSDPYAGGLSTFGGLLETTSNSYAYAGIVCDHVMEVTARPTAAVPINQGGSGLVNPPNWYPWLSGSNGEIFLNTRTFAALQTLRHCTLLGALKAVIWHQGETDAASAVTGHDYTAALMDLYDLIRAYIPDTPIMTVSLHDTPIASPGTWDLIRAAQNALIYPNHRVVPALGMPTLTAGDVHLSSMGLWQLGFELAGAILRVNGDLPQTQSPPLILKTMPGLKDYWLADSAHVSLTGSDINSWTGTINTAVMTAGTQKPIFTPDLFGVGKGGVVAAGGRVDAFLSYAIANRSAHTLIAGLFIPNMGSERTLLNFSNNTQAKLRINASEQIGYRGTQAAPSTTTLLSTTSFANSPVIVALRFIDDTQLQSFLNSVSANGTPLDPAGTYANQTMLRVLGGAAGEAPEGVRLRAFFHAERALSPWMIEQVIRHIAAQTGVTL